MLAYETHEEKATKKNKGEALAWGGHWVDFGGQQGNQSRSDPGGKALREGNEEAR